MGTADLISTTYQELAHDVKPGEHILLSDGRIELVVKEISGGDVICEVLNGGMLGEHQGINLPGTNVSIPSLTEKDEADLAFGLEHAVDVVAISFVRTADDVVRARRAIAARGGDAPLIAKLEKPQAIENLEAILEVANGVMVARGDLGVEVAPEKVPLIQKHVIRRALDFRKPVITATQMLESMTENPRPTRAEASDVANAIFDGTDAVMLSGESAVGKYPPRSGGDDGPHCGRGGSSSVRIRCCRSTARRGVCPSPRPSASPWRTPRGTSTFAPSPSSPRPPPPRACCRSTGRPPTFMPLRRSRQCATA